MIGCLTSSLLRIFRRPKGFRLVSMRPHQFVHSAGVTVSFGSTAGVHSTVWILAMTAELISLAVLNS